MKLVLKKFVVTILSWQVRRLRAKHQFKTIGVVGSIGKTSTKLAIAQVLGKTLRVRYQEGNYNDIVSVPLIYFGQDMPGLFNPLGWLRVFINNQKQIGSNYPYDIVVVELGTDSPGNIAAFKRYVKLDMAVITAVAPEHMEFFDSIDAVAEEEMAVIEYSDNVAYNADFISARYKDKLPPGSISYGIRATDADYHLANILNDAGSIQGDIKYGGEIYLHVSHDALSELQLYSLLAAVVTSKETGLSTGQILSGINAVHPVSGRLRRLRGINNSTIIDDTYNSSPEAVKAGLKALYALNAPQKIAVLGNMNELGKMSAEAHKEIGSLCDPSQLDLLITIGPDANRHLAANAEARGCVVKRFDSPYTAGEYLQGKVQPNALIFAKGSQNGVFAEEAVKMILADPEDKAKLVRQSSEWLKKKNRQFSTT